LEGRLDMAGKRENLRDGGSDTQERGNGGKERAS
jgi:hypothetical protein